MDPASSSRRNSKSMFVELLIFLIGVTAIFFLPNEWWVIAVSGIIIIVYSLARKTNYRKLISSLGNILPFVLLTFGFNWWLGDLREASFVALKLLLVCSATIIYTQTIRILDFTKEISKTFRSPKVAELTMMICIAFSMIVILKRDLTETKIAVEAKGLKLNLRTARFIIIGLLTRSLRRVEQLDEALRAKGVWNDN